nr:hypothetical protein [Cylindrospermum stagnale]
MLTPALSTTGLTRKTNVLEPAVQSVRHGMASGIQIFQTKVLSVVVYSGS